MNSVTPPATWTASRGARLDGRYELEEQIGVGGMGEVWRARHLALKNEVAIKFLSGALAAKKETRERFRVEAQVTAQLRSRNAVQVFDFGVTDEGQPYLVLELLHGETLASRLKHQGRRSPAEVVKIIRSSAKALSRAHALGIVHRDFKPDNVFLEQHDEGEEVKVVDFGIAKLIGNLEEARPSPTVEELTSKALTSLTRTNSFIGTPQYMSPEQVRQEKDVGPATDIWALAVVAFEALTGVQPFEGPTVVALFSNIQLGRRRLACALDPSIPPEFDAWFEKATALEPSARFADAAAAASALADALAPVTGGRPRLPSEVDEAPMSVTDVGAQLGGYDSVDSLPGAPRRAPWLVPVAVAVAIVATAAGAGAVFLRRSVQDAERDKRSPTSTTSVAAATTTAIPPIPSVPTATPTPTQTPAATASGATETPVANGPAGGATSPSGHGRRHGGSASAGGATADKPTTTTSGVSSSAPPPRPTTSSPFSLPPLGL